jgi:hypothetical protein
MQINLKQKTHKRQPLLNMNMNLNQLKPKPNSNIPYANKIIKKVIHVYQLQFKNQNTIFGLGDFLRGSFCLLQICNKHEIQFDIDVSNHPISNYMEGQIKNQYVNYNKIETNNTVNDITNPIITCKKIIQSLKNVTTENYYTCTNAFPPFEIKQSEIEFIKSRIEPNIAMKTDIEQEMLSLNLVSKQFSVIHIRTGDEFLLKGSVLCKDWIERIFALLTPILKNTANKYLILSDNNQLKMLLKKYDNCVVNIKPITHLGEVPFEKNENVKNTMMDFYVMSHSKEIYAISKYGHGTGFSKWCSVLNNIPYKITQL